MLITESVEESRVGCYNICVGVRWHATHYNNCKAELVKKFLPKLKQALLLASCEECVSNVTQGATATHCSL
jgi:hypothetical protein